MPLVDALHETRFMKVFVIDLFFFNQGGDVQFFNLIFFYIGVYRRPCLENPRDRGAWWAAVYGVTQSWTRLKRLSSSSSIQETWVQSLGQVNPLEKAMAPHSSTLAWKIPWMEEPGRLQSMGPQRVTHD